MTETLDSWFQDYVWSGALYTPPGNLGFSHKVADIDRVVALLEKEYSRNVFTYKLDTSRFMNTRMLPDVQIFNPSDLVKPICVVEIGYTRPEKLDEYRQRGVPDIRWYGKQNGKLYTFGDVAPLTHTVKINYDFKPSPEDIWYCVSLGTGLAPCLDVLKIQDDLCGALNTLTNKSDKVKYIRSFVKSIDCDTDLHFDGLVDNVEKFLVNVYVKEDGLSFDKLDDYVSQYTTNFLWSNGRGAILLQYCDFCGAQHVDLGDCTEFAWIWTDNDIRSYEAFKAKARAQKKKLVQDFGVVEDIAWKEYRKTAEELTIHLEDYSDNVPMVFNTALENGKNYISWIKERVG